jgi:hypothetical protein
MDFCRNGLILESLDAANANFNAQWAPPRRARRNVSDVVNLNKETHQRMTKSLEVISEAIRNPKHPFRKVDNQPKKPLKHRYERRKIKEYLHLGEVVTGEAT